MRSKLSKTVESWGRDPFQILLSWSHGCEATTVLVQKLYLLKIVRAEKTRGTQVTEQGVAGVGGGGCKHILSLTPFWQIKQRRIKSCKWPSYPSVCFENSTSWYLRTYWKISLSIDVKILSSWKVVCLLTMFSIAILLWKSSSSLQCILKMKMSLYVGWLNTLVWKPGTVKASLTPIWKQSPFFHFTSLFFGRSLRMYFLHDKTSFNVTVTFGMLTEMMKNEIHAQMDGLFEIHTHH